MKLFCVNILKSLKLNRDIPQINGIVISSVPKE